MTKVQYLSIFEVKYLASRKYFSSYRIASTFLGTMKHQTVNRMAQFWSIEKDIYEAGKWWLLS